MPIPFVLVKKNNPKDSLAPRRWYAAFSSMNEVSYNELCEEISYSSSATKGDVSLAIEGCLSFIIRHLSNGSIVQLGEFGRFHLSITNVEKMLNAEGNWVQAAPLKREDFKIEKNIEGCRIVFTPGNALKNMMKTAKYKLTEGGSTE